ncbi:hypothetical protein GCM10027615_26090 [Plantactinospora veratri]
MSGAPGTSWTIRSTAGRAVDAAQRAAVTTAQLGLDEVVATTQGPPSGQDIDASPGRPQPTETARYAGTARVAPSPGTRDRSRRLGTARRVAAPCFGRDTAGQL